MSGVGVVLTDTPQRAVEHSGGPFTLRGGQDDLRGLLEGKLLSLSSGPDSAALEGSWCSAPFESLSSPRLTVPRLQVSIPLSVKGRVIMETIEGMCYLHGEGGYWATSSHREHPRVDRDFHIKVNRRQGFRGSA